MAMALALVVACLGLVLSASGSTQSLSRQTFLANCRSRSVGPKYSGIFSAKPVAVSVSGNTGIALYATSTRFFGCLQADHGTYGNGDVLRLYPGTVRVVLVATNAGKGLWAIVRTTAPVASIDVASSNKSDRVQKLRDGYYLVREPLTFTSQWHSGNAANRLNLGMVVGFSKEGLVAGSDSLFACRYSFVAVSYDC
jgi:hypothetical protein